MCYTWNIVFTVVVLKWWSLNELEYARYAEKSKIPMIGAILHAMN